MKLTNTSSTPRSKDIYLWADYIELKCLINPDHQVTRADMGDRFAESSDLDAELMQADAEFDDPGNDALPLSVSQKQDRKANDVRDWYEHLSYRANVFGEYYPFYLSDNRHILYRQKTLTTKHKLYIFLLLVSNFRYLTNKERTRLAAYFELLCVAALKQFLQKTADIHIFGTNGLNRGGRYTGKIFPRIKLLCEDLKEGLNCTPADFNRRSSGDNGLDIVAWIKFGDPETHNIVYFAQCACTDEWETKQFSSSALRWRNFVIFSVDPTNFCFVPICFRDTSGKWHNAKSIVQTIMVDRVRLVHLLKDYNLTQADKFVPWDKIDSAINFQEALV